MKTKRIAILLIIIFVLMIGLRPLIVAQTEDEISTPDVTVTTHSEETILMEESEIIASSGETLPIADESVIENSVVDEEMKVISEPSDVTLTSPVHKVSVSDWLTKELTVTSNIVEKTLTINGQIDRQVITEIARLNGADTVHSDLTEQTVVQILNISRLGWSIPDTELNGLAEIDHEGNFSFTIPEIELPKQMSLTIETIINGLHVSDPFELSFNQVDGELVAGVVQSEEAFEISAVNSEAAIDVISSPTTVAVISDWIKQGITSKNNEVNGTTTIIGQIDLQKIVKIAMEASGGTANLNVSNIIQKTNMNSLKWSMGTGFSGTVAINKHTGAFTIIVPKNALHEKITFNIDILEFDGKTKKSYLEFGPVEQYISEIDVITSASTTAEINNWLMDVNYSDHSISGKINLDYVFQQVYKQGKWIEAVTTNSIIASQFEGQKIELLLGDEIRQTFSIHNSNTQPSGYEYKFEVNSLELAAIETITFRLVDEEIVFWGVTKPSKIILNDVKIPLLTEKTLSFGKVGDFIFETQIFNYGLDQQFIEQEEGSFLNVEVEGPLNSKYSLLASYSGELISGTTTILSELYYNSQPIDINTKIVEATGPRIFSFDQNFQLKILNPSDLIGDQTYKTTITWTLQNAE